MDFVIPGIKTPVIESNKPIDADKEFKKINKLVNNHSQLKIPQVNSPVSQMTPAEKITNTVNEYFQTPEGIATGHMVARQNTKRAEINQKIKEGHYILEPDDWAVEIPNFDDDDNIRL